MTIDPDVLTMQSRCFSCIPRGRTRSSWIDLLCRWAGAPIIERDLVVLLEASSASSYSTAAYQPSPNCLVLAAVWNRVSSGGATDPVSYVGNGLTWELVTTLVWITNLRLSIFRAMGSAPTNTIGTVDFGGVNQTRGCMIAVLEFKNTNKSGTNGSGAIVQTGSATANSTNPSLTLAALDSSGRNAIIGFSGNITNPYNATQENLWVENLDTGITVTLPFGAYITYQLASTDNTIQITKGSSNWGLIGLEIKAQ